MKPSIIWNDRVVGVFAFAKSQSRADIVGVPERVRLASALCLLK